MFFIPVMILVGDNWELLRDKVSKTAKEII